MNRWRLKLINFIIGIYFLIVILAFVSNIVEGVLLSPGYVSYQKDILKFLCLNLKSIKILIGVVKLFMDLLIIK